MSSYIRDEEDSSLYSDSHDEEPEGSVSPPVMITDSLTSNF